MRLILDPSYSKDIQAHRCTPDFSVALKFWWATMALINLFAIVTQR